MSAVQPLKQAHILVTPLGIAGAVVSASQPLKQLVNSILLTVSPVTLRISSIVGNAAYDVLLLSLTRTLAVTLDTVTL